MPEPTYSDGGSLTCSKCGASCLTHYAAKFHGEKFTRVDVCFECATSEDGEPELEMVCNECGEPANFRYGSAYATEPHGETHHDEWQACVRCGAKSEIGALDAVYHRPAIRAAEAR